MGIFNSIRWRIYYFASHIYWGLQLGYYGREAMIHYPDRIFGCKKIYIGDKVNIGHHARLETQGGGKLLIDFGTTIEERCHIIAAGDLHIGKECVISADVYISDCSHGYAHDELILHQPLKVMPTEVGYHCFIGIGAKIMPGVSLGDYCVVGANAVVTHDVPECAVVAGVPAKVIGYNRDD